MFESVLIANRGEIAVRVIRTLRHLGVRAVAVHSDADAGARHVREADVAIRVGPAPSAESYLDIGAILRAAAETGAEAVHPGYGFLAESADFARACTRAGLVFVGPPAQAIETMGDKIRARRAVAASGVPVVPGRSDPAMSDDDLVAAADEIGYPVLVKPAAGGGGKGMRLVHDRSVLPESLASARREAHSSFGDDTLFVERLVSQPRHIEVQVLADAHGRVVHLGERECSLQRRHQKIVEEAPSPLLDDLTRARIGEAAVEAARSVAYEGAGTVEFIVSARAPDEFFFMEMNTRLQVEHPVTELVTGIDLVEQQLRVAAGEALALEQADVSLEGHAVEARVYAEDPGRDFLPTGGRALLVREPALPFVRVDSSLVEGEVVGTVYDPLLSKVIAWGDDRASALGRLDRALADNVVLGLRTNVGFLRALVGHPDVRAGRLDTGLVERDLPAMTSADVPAHVYAAYLLHRVLGLWPRGAVIDPWEVPSGWRLGGHAGISWTVPGPDGAPLALEVTGTPGAAHVRIGDADPVQASVVELDDGLELTLDGRTRRVWTADDGDVTWVWSDGVGHAVRAVPLARRQRAVATVDGEVRSPMPGAVVSVRAARGDRVEEGSALLVVEAMKMEHAIVAPLSGVVTEIAVGVGDQVAFDQPLARVDAVPTEGADPPATSP